MKKILDATYQRIARFKTVWKYETLRPIADGVAMEIKEAVNINELNKVTKKTKKTAKSSPAAGRVVEGDGAPITRNGGGGGGAVGGGSVNVTLTGAAAALPVPPNIDVASSSGRSLLFQDQFEDEEEPFEMVEDDD